MPTSRTPSRAAQAARTQVLNDLKEDHKRVRKAYREFQKLDADTDSTACVALVDQVLCELSVHATLEDEFLYPAARSALPDDALVDEAEVEHESLHTLMDQLRVMGPDEEKYTAYFTVLCEYVLHHVKEEEGELFPALERSQLDWQVLAQAMNDRRAELTQTAEPEPAEGTEDAELPAPAAGRAARKAAAVSRG